MISGQRLPSFGILAMAPGQLQRDTDDVPIDVQNPILDEPWV